MVNDGSGGTRSPGLAAPTLTSHVLVTRASKSFALRRMDALIVVTVVVRRARTGSARVPHVPLVSRTRTVDTGTRATRPARSTVHAARAAHAVHAAHAASAATVHVVARARAACAIRAARDRAVTLAIRVARARAVALAIRDSNVIVDRLVVRARAGARCDATCNAAAVAHSAQNVSAVCVVGGGAGSRRAERSPQVVVLRGFSALRTSHVVETQHRRAPQPREERGVVVHVARADVEARRVERLAHVRVVVRRVAACATAAARRRAAVGVGEGRGGRGGAREAVALALTSRVVGALRPLRVGVRHQNGPSADRF